MFVRESDKIRYNNKSDLYYSSNLEKGAWIVKKQQSIDTDCWAYLRYVVKLKA